jgi:N,N'-diacetyllegionaminate synthase
MEIIAEIGNTHEGSLGVAKSFVDMACSAGVTVVKFQMHLAEAEGMTDEPFRVNFSDQDRTRQDYWRRVNFTESSWIKLANYCENKGVEFLCTALSLEAAKFLHENKLVKRWKVGSGNAADWPLLKYLLSTRLPILISTGLVSSDEIAEIKDFFHRNNSADLLTLLHCVSSYPVRIEEIDMHLMNDLRSGGFKVGYSDHSGSIFPSLYALALGAESIEVHMTPRKDYFGPDVSSSLTPEEMSFLVNYVKSLEVMKSSVGTKPIHFDRVSQLRQLFRKGIYWSRDIEPGEEIQLQDLKFLKPVRGIDVVNYELILGKKTNKSVKAFSPANWDDLD